MQNITNLNCGESAIICDVRGDLKIKKRLLELGFIKGEEVAVLAISSLKKTFLLKIQGYVIAIRHNILKEVLICKK